ncbi:MAG: hypothetical protein K0Q73_4442 [Paenibacillus sp.]|nr:hypothetical protein [Paenibacillus sp.]
MASKAAAMNQLKITVFALATLGFRNLMMRFQPFLEVCNGLLAKRTFILLLSSQLLPVRYIVTIKRLDIPLIKVIFQLHVEGE